MPDVLQTISFNEIYASRCVNVSFSIKSEIETLSEISEILLVTPTTRFAKGESYRGKIRDEENGSIIEVTRHRSFNLWTYETNQKIHSKKVEDHLIHLLEILEPAKERNRKYIENSNSYETRIVIYWVPVDNWGSYEVSGNILKKIADYCQILEFAYILRC